MEVKEECEGDIEDEDANFADALDAPEASEESSNSTSEDESK